MTNQEYEAMIAKRPSLKPTEVIKAQNTHEGFLQLAEKCLALNANYDGPIVQEKCVKSLPRPNLKASNDESKLNKTETAWLAELRIRNPKFLGIQAMTFKLGDDCRYSPDFICITQDDELIAYEVKGFFRDDAKVKIKVAARMFSWIKFVLVFKVKNGWELKDVPP